MISKKTRIDKWNYYSNIYSVLCKYIACYGNEVRKMCDNNEIGFYFSGSLTLAHSQNSQMSFMYGFFFVKFLFFTVVCVVIVV